MVQGRGFGGLGFRVLGVGFRALGLELWIWGCGFLRVFGFKTEVSQGLHRELPHLGVHDSSIFGSMLGFPYV